VSTFRECTKEDCQSGYGDTHQAKEEDEDDKKKLTQMSEQSYAFQEPSE
jgi:hypothetical protein